MKSPLVIHPPLFTLFPFLFFYAHNIQEMHTLSLSFTLLLLGFLLGLTFLILFLFATLFKDKTKAALATTILIVTILVFSSLYDLIAQRIGFAGASFILALSQTLLLVVFILGIVFLGWLILRSRFTSGLSAKPSAIVVVLVLLLGAVYGLAAQRLGLDPGYIFLMSPVIVCIGYCFYRLGKSRRDFRIATLALNAAAITLTVMNVFSIGHYEVTAARSLSALSDDQETMPVAPVGEMPDIYFIILDEYAHVDTMKEHYDYDNTHFIQYLKDRGFFVAPDSVTMYEETVMCVASILNMEVTCEHEHRRVTLERINQNRVMQYLESLGYNLIYFGHYSELGRYVIDAHLQMNYYLDADYSPFTVQFTNFMLASNIAAPLVHNHIADSEYVRYHRNAVRNTLKHLGETPALDGPKFVFAHLMIPHVPFIFGPEGEHVPPEHMFNYADKEYYRGQYIYATQQIMTVIERILEQSDHEPIIILQSDHGPRWLDGWEQILNAMYLPQDGDSLLHDAISPVDTFRVIFNHYFDAGLEPEAELFPMEQ